jgi:amidase
MRFENIAQQLDFSKTIIRLKPLILEQNIPTIQAHIQSGSLNYEKLTKWYLYRCQIEMIRENAQRDCCH